MIHIAEQRQGNILHERLAKAEEILEHLQLADSLLGLGNQSKRIYALNQWQLSMSL